MWGEERKPHVTYLELIDHVASVQVVGVPSVDDVCDSHNHSVDICPSRPEVVEADVVLDRLNSTDEGQLRLDKCRELLLGLKSQGFEST